MSKEFSGAEPYFLATTALEKFWDTSKPILFFSESCRRYSRRAIWDKLDSRVIETPWATYSELEASWHHAGEVFEDLLLDLSEAMNHLHGMRHGLRYWRIVLGPWLIFYVDVNLDRFVRVREALSRYPDSVSYSLSENCFVTPVDALDFVRRCKSDPYNLQIYSRIFSYFGRKFPLLEANENSVNPLLPPKGKMTPKMFFFKAANLLIKKVSVVLRDRPGVMIKSTFFSPEIETQMFLRTLGKVRPVPRRPIRLEPVSIDYARRMELNRFLKGGDDFKEYLKQVLPLDLPQIFVESYAALKKEVKAFPSRPTAIFSSNAYFFDESFQVWAAEHAEAGVPIIGSQHGGNYGIAKHHTVMDHEMKICDRFYTWGWQERGTIAEIIPFVSAKLSGRFRTKADNSKAGILFTSTTNFRYLVNIPFSQEFFEDYLVRQQKFIMSLGTDAKKALRVRLTPESFGWDLHERWSDTFPDVYIEPEGDYSFTDSLKSCRPFVADHIATTYIEALASNVPSVLFYNESALPLKEGAKQYFDLLKEVGVLLETPEAAARMVNLVYPDVEKWWNDPDRQKAVREFCDHYGRTSPNAVSLWTEELLKLYHKAHRQTV
ncbi:MAG: hypothetical protein HY888_13540 [Deltaproteobacteria bacterium]|nr:hypothetical protein [Deltaproteobacteria bacterium]